MMAAECSDADDAGTQNTRIAIGMCAEQMESPGNL
jgi:hypothetical protein